VIYADAFVDFILVDGFRVFENSVQKIIFERKIEDLTSRTEENYALKSFVICILRQIFLGRLSKRCCGGGGGGT
jgi:hypothetical protein